MKTRRGISVLVVGVVLVCLALTLGACTKTISGSGSGQSGSSSTTSTAGGGSSSDTGGAVKIDTSQNGSSQTLAKGQELIIALEANPSTGYEWQPKDGKVPAQLEPVGEAKFEQGGKPGMAGAGGVSTWTFKGAEAGTGKLTLVYVRPWEEQAKPAQVFDVTVTVK